MTKAEIELGMKIRDIIGSDDMEYIGNVEVDGETYELDIEMDGDWDDQGKYQYREVVVKVEGTDILLSQCATRSGSYFSDYYYEYDRPELVKKVEKTVRVVNYVGIKNK